MSLVFPNRRSDLNEHMDSPGIDAVQLWNAYSQFGRMNRLVAGWRAIYERDLRPRLAAGGGHATLLDVGFGGGDVVCSLLDWAEADGHTLRVTAIDPDPRARAYIRHTRPDVAVDWRVATTRDLIGSGARFDFVISNHLLHHLTDDELRALLADSAALATRFVLHNDTCRSGLAYALLALFGPVAFHGSLIVLDGLTSIRRSFTRRDLQAVAGEAWTVRSQPLFRLHLLRDVGPRSSAQNGGVPTADTPN